MPRAHLFASRPIRRAAHACALLLIAARMVTGQGTTAPAKPGALRVRVHYGIGDTTLTGRMLTARGDSIVVLADDGSRRTAFEVARITGLDTSTGRRWGMSTGARVGAGLGTGLGLLAASTMKSKGTCTYPGTASCQLAGAIETSVEPIAQAAVILFGFVGGAVVGLVAGAGHAGENWDGATIDEVRGRSAPAGPGTSIAPTLDVSPGGVGLRMRVAVRF